MYKVVGFFKSGSSYERIKSQVNNPNILWDDNITNLEAIQERIYYTKFDLVIIDDKIRWQDGAIELLDKFAVPYILFHGDFEEITKVLVERFSKKNEDVKEEEVLNLSTSTEDEDTNVKIKYVPIIERVEVDREVAKNVYKPMYAGIRSQLIVVCNLSKRAGSTYLTLNLAGIIADNKVLSSVVELPIDKPYIFNYIGIDHKLEPDKEYYSYPHAIAANEKLKKGREVIIDDVLWVVQDPRLSSVSKCDNEEVQWDYFSLMKLIYATRSASITLIDAGDYVLSEEVSSILADVDLILVVVDPMPSDCMQYKDKLNALKSMKEQGFPVEFVVNKWVGGIDKEDFLKFLGCTPIAFLPAVPYELNYMAAYEYKMPYMYDEIKDLIDAPLTSIVKLILPMDILSKEEDVPSENDSPGLFKFIFKRKKESE